MHKQFAWSLRRQKNQPNDSGLFVDKLQELNAKVHLILLMTANEKEFTVHIYTRNHNLGCLS